MIFGAISDDFTGGLELASLLVREGIPCPFVTDVAAIGHLAGTPAVVIAQKTRIAPARHAVEAVGAVATALAARKTRQIFFKYCATFDSTPAGNIGPCTDVLMERAGAEFTAFCPSFPEVARTVYQGHLFVGDRLVSESPKRFDPMTPMEDPDLVRVLQRQTRHPVGLLPRFPSGPPGAALRRRAAELQASGIRYGIADAIDETDLRDLAAATVDWPLMTGGSSVAVYYPALWRERGLVGDIPAVATLPAVGGHAAILAGSCADRTLQQLAAFGEQHPVLSLELHRAIDGADLVGAALEWAAPRVAKRPIAIATSADAAGVASVQERIGRAAAAELAEGILGRIARGLVELGVRRLIVAGGETSGAVVQALGRTVFAVGSYEAPGISRAVSTEGAALALCLKSGKLGPVDMFATVLEQMRSGVGR